jgi:transposase
VRDWRDERIAQLEAEVATKDERIAALEQQVASLMKQVAELADELAYTRPSDSPFNSCLRPPAARASGARRSSRPSEAHGS